MLGVGRQLSRPAHDRAVVAGIATGLHKAKSAIAAPGANTSRPADQIGAANSGREGRTRGCRAAWPSAAISGTAAIAKPWPSTSGSRRIRARQHGAVRRPVPASPPRHRPPPRRSVAGPGRRNPAPSHGRCRPWRNSTRRSIFIRSACLAGSTAGRATVGSGDRTSGPGGPAAAQACDPRLASCISCRCQRVAPRPA